MKSSVSVKQKDQAIGKTFVSLTIYFKLVIFLKTEQKENSGLYNFQSVSLIPAYPVRAIAISLMLGSWNHFEPYI